MIIRPISQICMMCLGIILALTCYANFPALQPQFEILWNLSKMESGLIFGIFFGGVLAGTPILSPLADKYDPRRVGMLSAALMASSAFCHSGLDPESIVNTRPQASGCRIKPVLNLIGDRA